MRQKGCYYKQGEDSKEEDKKLQCGTHILSKTKKHLTKKWFTYVFLVMQNSRVGRAVQAIFAYIMQFQSKYLRQGANGVPERVIRVEFGNNPDTSKALRYLVTEEKIIRAGIGGRRDPFSYTISPELPKLSATQENDESLQSCLLRTLVTPNKKELDDPNLASAAGMLTNPSVVKESPVSEVENKTRPRRHLQPRLSFGEAVSTTHMSTELNQKLARVPLATLSPMKGKVYASTVIGREKEILDNELTNNGALQTKMNGDVVENPFLMLSGISSGTLQSSHQGTMQNPSIAQAAYLMQLQAQLLWQQTLLQQRLHNLQDGTSAE